MARFAVLVALVAGCGAALPDAAQPTVPSPRLHRTTPPAPAPAPVADDDGTTSAPAADISIALVSGRWHGVDDQAWQYDLEVETDGSFTQLVHQVTEGDVACQQTGTVTIDTAQLLRTFRENECNHEYDGKTVHDRVISLDDRRMVLRMESDYLIRYDRTP